ncbi:MAG: SBBP repeat-containing protein, partial [Acidobacteria bacterium]|nr:SBBP repeat-containing protein [Acidobacteriota bacterium]
LTLDSQGNLYLTGQTSSPDFPLADPFQSQVAGGTDVFITKMDPLGRTILFSTYVGGQLADSGRSIGLDRDGNIYVGGMSFSNNFPTTAGAFQTQCSGLCPFAFKMNPQGTALVYSTIVGRGTGLGLAVDPVGEAVLYGMTNQSDFPTVNAAQPQKGGGADAFVAKLNASGSQLVFSTYLGGAGDENLGGLPRVALDPGGNIYVTGRTNSTDFPVTNPAQGTFGGGRDAFVTKYSPAGVIIHSTYLGGDGDDDGIGITADSAGNAYVVGVTRSANFPVKNAFQNSFGGFSDAFLTKISPTGGPSEFSTYLGSTGADLANDVALADNREILVVGQAGTAFPLVKPLRAHDPAIGGGTFLVRFSSDGASLLFSTLLGGPAGEAVAVRGDHVYLGGRTVFKSFPLVQALQPHFPGLSADGQNFITLVNFSLHLYFAQVGNGGGIISELLLSNPSSENTATVTIDFFADDGSPMRLHLTSPPGEFSRVPVTVSPRGVAKIVTTGQGEVQAGAVRVSSDVALGGVVRFQLPDIGIAGVGGGPASAAFITPVRRTAINTGVAIHNVVDRQVSLRLTLRNAAGQTLQGGQTTIQLAAHGHLARFIDGLFRNLNLDGFEGTLTVEVTGEGAIAATALELGSQPGQFTTLPVTPLP